MTLDLAGRVRGAMLGTFVGDALGVPFEGTPVGGLEGLARAIARRVAAPAHWRYSDDTEMMIGVAESIVATGGVDARHVLETLAANLDPARGYGRGMKLLVRALADGAPWESVATSVWPEGSRGNGGAARVAPIACAFHDDEDALTTAVTRATRVTHANDVAVDGALLLARAIAWLLRGAASRGLVDALSAMLPLEDRLYRLKLEAIARLRGTGPSRRTVVEALGHGVEADTSVPLALFAFVDARPSFTDVVTHAIGFGGDTDTIGAMAGALAGAAFGDETIPSSWLAALENGPRGRDHVARLADAIVTLRRSRLDP